MNSNLKDIEDIYFRLLKGENRNKLCEEFGISLEFIKEIQKNFRPNKRISKKSINIFDASNLEYKITANAKIFFGSKLNFSLLFTKDFSYQNEVRARFQIEKSSIGLDIYIYSTLISDIVKYLDLNKNFIGNPIIDTDYGDTKWGQYLFVKKDLSIASNYHDNNLYLYQFDKYISISAKIKGYKFNFLNFIFLKDKEYLLILGMDLDSTYLGTINQEIKIFYDKLQSNIKESIDALEIIEDRSNYFLDKSYRIYAQMIRTFKKILEDEYNIENVHLFLFNAYDRRLYYNFIESMQITETTLKNYKNVCMLAEEKNRQLSKDQIVYIKNRIKKLINQNFCKLTELYEILDNLHNYEWILNYLEGINSLNDSKEIKDRVWKILLVLSNIPQEPWTGVAGFAAYTRTMDISITGEKSTSTEIQGFESRWEPQSVNKAYFYHKLAIYETIAGVGGKGSMAAFPVLDSGQIAGVLFVTKPESAPDLLFTSKALNRILSLTSILKNFILFKRKNDFNNNVITALISDPLGIAEPFKIIGNYLPDLFNPLLVIIWEKQEKDIDRVQRPKYIWGFKKGLQSDDGLLPLSYELFPIDHDLYNTFIPENFEFIKNLNEPVFNEEEPNKPNSFKNAFRKEYEYISEDKPEIELAHRHSSVGRKIRSGIVFYHKDGSAQTWLVIYSEESKMILDRNIILIKDKLSIIRRILSSNRLLKNILDSKFASTHELHGAFLTPLALNLEVVNEAVGSLIKDIGQGQSILVIKSVLDYCYNNLLPMLTSAILRIDKSTTNVASNKLESFPLVSIIEEIWRNQKLIWNHLSEVNKLYTFFNKNAKLIFYGNNDFNKIISFVDSNGKMIIVNQELFDKMETVTINFTKERFYEIIYILMSNTFKKSILPYENLLDNNPERANIYISIVPAAPVVEFYYVNQGKELSSDISKWIKIIFNFVKTTKGKLDIINPELYDEYIKIKVNEKDTRPHGFGLFNAARYLYQIFENNHIDYIQDLIKVENTEGGKKTIFKIIFPIS